MNKEKISKCIFLLFVVIIVIICSISKSGTQESLENINLDVLIKKFNKQNKKYNKLINKLNYTNKKLPSA